MKHNCNGRGAGGRREALMECASPAQRSERVCSQATLCSAGCPSSSLRRSDGKACPWHSPALLGTRGSRMDVRPPRTLQGSCQCAGFSTESDPGFREQHSGTPALVPHAWQLGAGGTLRTWNPPPASQQRREQDFHRLLNTTTVGNMTRHHLHTLVIPFLSASAVYDPAN